MRSNPDGRLYSAILDAEAAARRAHDLCYKDGGHGASMWLAMALGKAQNILMRQVVRYSARRR